MINKFLHREMERIGFCCTKTSDPQLKALGVKLQLVPQPVLDKVMNRFLMFTKRKTQDEFWEWRSDIHDLYANNYFDERMNVRQPMGYQRTVWNLKDIDYEPEVKISDTM